MAENNEASPICRGKNITWETVLLFYNNMPKLPMPKAEFHKFIETKINGWTQTHSQIARQLAFYYEENNICYPRFSEASSLIDLVTYMHNWACNYFIPNPFTPSLSGKSPVNIYSYLMGCVKSGDIDFKSSLNNMLGANLSSQDKIKVFLNDFSNLRIDSNGCMSISEDIKLCSTIKTPSPTDSTDSKLFFHYFDPNKLDLKSDFEYYLRYCINSARRAGTQFRYGVICKF